MHDTIANDTVVQPVATSTRLLAAIGAALFGLVILYGAGFAPHLAHNVGHDARHSAAFPCH
jgi:cobalt transporter subunit CbtB